ncbi:MAG: YfiR/HmsC family protein [Bacteroidales bacterium]|nr:YfiR/HmsC family protein [Bacteroidales bacterium]
MSRIIYPFEPIRAMQGKHNETSHYQRDKCFFMQKMLLFFKLIFFVFLYPTAIYSQSYTNTDRANYIIDIAQYVTWKNARAIETYKIGVLDMDSVLFNEFQSIAQTRNIQEKPIEVYFFNNIPDIRDVEIIFVNRNTGFDIDLVYQQIKGKGILLISENFPFHKSMINFIVYENRKRFEINQNRMQEEGFRTTVTFAALAVMSELDWHSIYKETERELYEQKEKVEQQKLLIEEQQAILSNLTEEVEVQRTRLINYIEEIELLEEETEAQKQSLNNLQLLNKSRERALKEKERVLAGLNMQVSSKEIEIEEQHLILEQKIADINKQNELITEQDAVLNQQLKKLQMQNIIINLAIVLILVFIGLVYFIYRNYRIKKLGNIRLAEKNKEILKQKEIIQIEKDKSDKLLLNILPMKVAEDLKLKGFTEPEEFKNVSIFFSDFAGFTEKSSKLEPRVLIEELNDLYTAFDNIMQDNKCERIKTIGDAYLAVCGLPTANADHAQHLVNAAQDIVEYLENRNKTTEIQWHIRIGINSGKVVGGIVGVKKFIYDIFGDTINVASRMESNSESMRINVSENTYSLLTDKFEFEKRGQIFVKGKGYQNMYFILGKKAFENAMN